MNVPVWVPVVCVNVQKFVYQIMIVSIKSWGDGPLALLLEVSEVDVLPGIEVCGYRRSGFKGVG